MAAMREAVHSFADMYERLRTERPIDFSILGVLRKRYDELTHSCLLAWLLDPRGDHEQGALFLSAFAPLIGLQAAPESLRRCQVRTECRGPESRIDIMLWRPGEFLVFIENKVWSPEGEEQVDREFRDLRYTGTTMGVPPDRQFAVFLTPSGRGPISGDPSRWICVSYGQLRQCMGAIVSQITDAKVRMVAEDWLEVTSDWG